MLHRPHLAAALLLLTVGALGVASPAAAQRATLRGFVSDAADGQTLPSVHVAIEDAAGNASGMATDANGFYQIAGVIPGRYVLRASFIGYEPHVDTLDLAPGVQRLDVALTEATLILGETTVQAERVSGSANVTAGLQRIRPEDVERVPAPDVSGDLANYLATLPGVVTTGDQGGQLFIRGGEPSQNLVLLDGIPVFQPFHLIGFYSAIQSDILASADLYAGGYNARYGGRLSSVLDVTARNGNLERLSASASVSPLVAGVVVEGPLSRGVASALFAGRWSVIEQGAARLSARPLPFRFGDAFAKVHVVPRPSSRLSLSGLYTFDEGALGDSASFRPDEVRYSNAGVGLRFLRLPTNIPLLAEVLMSFSDLRTGLGPRPGESDSTRGPTRSSRLTSFHTDVNLTYSVGRTLVRGGGFVHYTNTGSELGDLFSNFSATRTNAMEIGLYADPEFEVGGVLRLTPGVRFTHLPELGQQFFEPRLRAVLELGRHRLSAAAGLYNQPLVAVTDRRDATSVFTAYTIAPEGRTPRALHVVGGYRVQPLPWLEAAFEGYYKRLRDLSVAAWSAVPELTTRLQPADGEAVGLDGRAELRAPSGAFLSLNYGWSAVTYAVTQGYYDLWYGTETLRFRPPHDRRHQATVVANAPVFGFDVAVRWQFGSGLPYSRALGFDTFAPPVGGTDVWTEAGEPRVIYERPYNGRLPAYHRLDATVQRAFDLGAATLTAQVGVVNAYDRRNLFAYDVFTLRRVDQLPFLPTFGLRLSTD